jgi:hypothetical protein
MRKLDPLWIATCVALASSTVYFWHAQDSERARADALQTRLRKVEAAGTPRVEATPARASASVTAPPAPTPTAGSSAPDSMTDDLRESFAERRRLLADPNYRDAWRNELKLQHAGRVDEIARVLRLAPATASALLDIFVEHDLERELIPVPFPPATDAERDAFANHAFRLEQLRQQRERELLGDAVYEQLTTFREGIATRNQVKEFRAQLSSTPDPLRAEQYERLVAALLPERAQMERNLSALVESRASDDRSIASLREFQARVEALDVEGYRRMRHAASPILSRSQLAALEALWARERDVSRARAALHLGAAEAREAQGGLTP